MIFTNNSRRIVSVVSLATLDAMRFATTLNVSASTEQTSITNPHTKISFRLPCGITVSIIYASIQGRHRSMIVPINLMTNPSSMRP